MRKKKRFLPGVGRLPKKERKYVFPLGQAGEKLAYVLKGKNDYGKTVFVFIRGQPG